jgi:hypothetical protein
MPNLKPHADGTWTAHCHSYPFSVDGVALTAGAVAPLRTGSRVILDERCFIFLEQARAWRNSVASGLVDGKRGDDGV